MATVDRRARPRGEVELEQQMLGAVVIVRWVALAWMLSLLAWEWARGGAITEPSAVAVLAAATTAFTLWATVAQRRDPAALTSAAALVVEVTIAVNLGLADGYAFDGTQAQHFGSAWPLASVLSVGVVLGTRAGLLVGVVVGLSGFAGVVLHAALSDDSATPALSADSLSSGVLYALAGGASGLAATRLRTAERRLAVAQAREEVARDLHDGVLQTLAVIRRRSDDPELVALAEEQERELREYLRDRRSDPAGGGGQGVGLLDALGRVAAAAERTQGLRVELVHAEPITGWDGVAPHLAGAVQEALANAAKNGGSSSATVFVEETDDGELFCSVKDDGDGFEVGTTPEGVGLTHSVRGRLAEVGGRAELASAPGRGTELRLSVPRPRRIRVTGSNP